MDCEKSLQPEEEINDISSDQRKNSDDINDDDVIYNYQNSRRSESHDLKLIELAPQILASSIAYLVVIQAGISMSFSSVLITQLADTKDIPLDSESASWLASIWALSLPIGALTSGILMDRYGRRKTILLICFPFTFAWLLISMAQNITMIFVSRILLGISTGITTASVVYVSEISSKNIRSGLLW